jgi:hypothetical protein
MRFIPVDADLPLLGMKFFLFRILRLKRLSIVGTHGIRILIADLLFVFGALVATETGVVMEFEVLVKVGFGKGLEHL